jgi:hypothetical protein
MLANPYQSPQQPKDETVVDPTVDDFEIVAMGPLTFSDFRHALRVGLGRYFLMTGCVIAPLVGFVLFKATTVELIGFSVTGVFLLLFAAMGLLLTHGRDRRLYEKIEPVRRWVITKVGFRQDGCDGSSMFISYSSIAHAKCTDRVAVILLRMGGRYFVPRSGFRAESEWQSFQQALQNIGGFFGRDSTDKDAVGEDTVANDSEAIVVTGPMNADEAATMFRIYHQQLTFFQRHFFSLIAMAGFGAVLFCLVRLLSDGKLNRAEIAAYLPSFVGLLIGSALMALLCWLLRVYVKWSIISFNRWVVRRDGIEIEQNQVSMKTSWDSVKWTQVIPEGVLLFGKEKHVVYLIPRSGFRSEDDWNKACNLDGIATRLNLR